MTEEERKGKIAALLEERRGYEVRFAAASDEDIAAQMQSRLDAVSVALRSLGHGAVKPVERAERRPSAARVKAEKRG